MVGQKALSAIAVFALGVSALGCASRRAAPPAEMAPAVAEDAEGMCPMRVPGSRLDVTDTPDGVALTFMTDRGDAGEIRNRVRRMAEMNNLHVQPTMPQSGAAPVPPAMVAMMITATPARAMVEEMAQGARIVMVPLDPSRRDAIRFDARQRADRMRAGECPRLGP